MPTDATVNQRELAEFLGVDQSRVSKWLKSKGIKRPYKRDQTMRLYIKDLGEKAGGRYTETVDGLDPMQERARKDKAMADRYERENAIAEGLLADKEQIESAVMENNRRAKVRLLRLPREVAVAVPREIANIAEQETKMAVREALEELSDADSTI